MSGPIDEHTFLKGLEALLGKNIVVAYPEGGFAKGLLLLVNMRNAWDEVHKEASRSVWVTLALDDGRRCDCLMRPGTLVEERHIEGDRSGPRV